MSEKTGTCLCDTTEQHPTSECIAPWETPTDVQQRDVRHLLDALGLDDHARPYSPHAVIHRDVLPAIMKLREAAVDLPALLAAERERAWDEGWGAAYTMARNWGHVDGWEDEWPDNPYRTEPAPGEEW